MEFVFNCNELLLQDATAAMEKGILGIKKDPKNQMLFSFVVRNGEEWVSSDSGDSDYSPGSDGYDMTGFLGLQLHVALALNFVFM